MIVDDFQKLLENYNGSFINGTNADYDYRDDELDR